MDTIRYYLTLFLVIATPGGLLFWLSVHPFVRFWRRVGPGLTLTIHLILIAVVAAGLFLVRKPLLSAQFGTNLVLITLALPIYVLAVVVVLQRRKQLRIKVLVGLPELAPEKHGTKLLTEGIYSRIRHPRYVEILLSILAYAMFTNYLAVYVLFLLSLAVILLIVWLEEKELRARFGEEYERYCQRVPRFVPRFWLRPPHLG